MSEINVNLSEQEQVRRAKLQKLVDEGKNPFEKTLFDVTAHSDEIKNNYDELEGKEVEGGVITDDDIFVEGK